MPSDRVRRQTRAKVGLTEPRSIWDSIDFEMPVRSCRSARVIFSFRRYCLSLGPMGGGGGEACAALPVAARGLRGAGLAGPSLVPVRLRPDLAMTIPKHCEMQGIIPGGEADIERSSGG